MCNWAIHFAMLFRLYQILQHLFKASCFYHHSGFSVLLFAGNDISSNLWSMWSSLCDTHVCHQYPYLQPNCLWLIVVSSSLWILDMTQFVGHEREHSCLVCNWVCLNTCSNEEKRAPQGYQFNDKISCRGWDVFFWPDTTPRYPLFQRGDCDGIFLWHLRLSELWGMLFFLFNLLALQINTKGAVVIILTLQYYLWFEVHVLEWNSRCDCIVIFSILIRNDLVFFVKWMHDVLRIL